MLEYLIRYFPEITLKSRPVRQRMQRRLRRNLRRALTPLAKEVRLERRWDSMSVHLPQNMPDERRGEAEKILSRTPGVGHYLEVETHSLPELSVVAEMLIARHAKELVGKTFAVRCRRRGEHPFSSMEVESFLGRALLQHTDADGVDLDAPELVVRVEIDGNELRLIGKRHAGPGGFPLGELEAGLTLFSGGFDSSVAAYRMMRRGALSHFCFFELQEGENWSEIAGIADKIARYTAPAHRLIFLHVPFDEIVAEISRNIDEAYRNVALKRMMLRVAERCAEELDLRMLITGDSLSQVASQTMANLRASDAAIDMLALRPLIACHKPEIMGIARDIGIAADCERIKESCGAMSRHPKTAVEIGAIEAKERKLDIAGLTDRAASRARRHMLGVAKAPVRHPQEPDTARRDSFAKPEHGAVVIDLRHPDEVRRQPLKIESEISVLSIPFYELTGKFSTLPADKRYFLYCDRGLMSKIQAARLRSQGYDNVDIYERRDI